MRHDPRAPAAEVKWFTEVKPRVAHWTRNLSILAYAAARLGETVLVFAFDFKYFFHQFVLASSELAHTGLIVPERVAANTAGPRHRQMLEQVLSMGTSPSSNVCQDVANALMWRLLRDFDAADAPHL